MLFMVQMQVNLPADMPAAQADKLKADEKALAQQLQRDGKWKSLWRVVGRYANVSIFDVQDNDELHLSLIHISSPSTSCRSGATTTSAASACPA